MVLRAGKKIWIPCQVKPGPFPDERMVLISLDEDQWFGFVSTQWLKEKKEEGTDDVLGTVVEVDNGTFLARIPGCSPRSGLFRGRTDRAVHIGSLSQ